LRPAISRAGFVSQAIIPLQATREVVGVMTLSSKKERVFSARELDLLTTIGMWAGTAIQNALLQQQTKHIAVLEERERIGMDLHDGIIQSLYSIGLTLDLVKTILKEDPKESQEKLEFATDGINSTITDIRAYISDLRPRQMQESKSFAENLEILLKEFETISKISSKIKNDLKTPLNITEPSTVTLFRIAQESLSNTARHSKATKTELHIWDEDGKVYLKINDNGQGFNIDKTEATLGHGLANMQRRSEKVGGGINIESAPGKGTEVLTWVPRE
jgi:signal transduction histidine kinase